MYGPGSANRMTGPVWSWPAKRKKRRESPRISMNAVGTPELPQILPDQLAGRATRQPGGEHDPYPKPAAPSATVTPRPPAR